jgi:hypothetical protein
MKGILFKPWKIKFIAEHPDMELMTRRVIKPQPKRIDNAFDGTWEWKEKGHYYDDLTLVGVALKGKSRYRIGETVYIKEAHYRYGYWVKNGLTKTGKQKWAFDPAISLGDAGFRYSENKPEGVLPNSAKGMAGWFKRSPLFMPERFARYFIVITDVRAERLSLPLSAKELELEGGEEALAILKNLNGKWVWVYSFKLKA